MFEAIATADRLELWRDWGARNMAHWPMRYGISHRKARRWTAAAYALEDLPRISEAFARGEVSVDKVVELCRLATPETEGRLLAWAGRVSCVAIRPKGDLAAAGSIEEAADAERARFVSWWWSDDGRRFGLAAELPRPPRGRWWHGRVDERPSGSRSCRSRRWVLSRGQTGRCPGGLCSARLGRIPIRTGQRW